MVLIADWVRVELALSARLRAMNKALECLVPDTHLTISRDVVEAVLEAVDGRNLPEAVGLIGEVHHINPCWFPGYLFLATIYEDTGRHIEAIHVLGRGLDLCAQGFRLVQSRHEVATRRWWYDTVERLEAARDLERFRRYQQIFLHRITRLHYLCGCFDEVMEQWGWIEDMHWS